MQTGDGHEVGQAARSQGLLIGGSQKTPVPGRERSSKSSGPLTGALSNMTGEGAAQFRKAQSGFLYQIPGRSQRSGPATPEDKPHSPRSSVKRLSVKRIIARDERRRRWTQYHPAADKPPDINNRTQAMGHPNMVGDTTARPVANTVDQKTQAQPVSARTDALNPPFDENGAGFRRDLRRGDADRRIFARQNAEDPCRQNGQRKSAESGLGGTAQKENGPRQTDREAP